jgi:hypothetical protein
MSQLVTSPQFQILQSQAASGDTITIEEFTTGSPIIVSSAQLEPGSYSCTVVSRNNNMTRIQLPNDFSFTGTTLFTLLVFSSSRGQDTAGFILITDIPSYNTSIVVTPTSVVAGSPVIVSKTNVNLSSLDFRTVTSINLREPGELPQNPTFISSPTISSSTIDSLSFVSPNAPSYPVEYEIWGIVDQAPDPPPDPPIYMSFGTFTITSSSQLSYSTKVQLDLNYGSFGTTSSVIQAVSLDPFIYDLTLLTSAILQDANSGNFVYLSGISGASPGSCLLTIPSYDMMSFPPNSLCMVLLASSAFVGQQELAGLFLLSTDLSLPLTVSPTSGPISTEVTVSQSDVRGEALVFNSSNYDPTPPASFPYLATTQLNSLIVPTGPYNGTTFTPSTLTPNTFRFIVPSTTPNTYNILITYTYRDFGDGINYGPIPMNIGTFTVTSEPSPPVICFKEDSKILCIKNNKEQEIPIQDIKRGTLVKTLRNGFVPVKIVGKSTVYNSGNNERIKDRLYKLSKSKYPELNEDLYVTGCHSILVDSITVAQRSKIENILGKIYVTDKKYRLLTCVDERAEPYEEEGTFNIYHLALESEENNKNYGIYANGLLVESCFERRIENQMIKID